MQYRSRNRYCHPMIVLWFYLCAAFMPLATYSQQTYQSLLLLSIPGVQFNPANPSAQVLSSLTVDSLKACAMACNGNPLCRIFDYGAIKPKECRLFEGDIDILGSIGPASLPDSQGGLIQINPSLFTAHGQSCSSVCVESRYLRCDNKSLYECMPHSYWDVSQGLCLPQMTIAGAYCEPQMNMCREDLNLTCSSMNQCEVVVANTMVGGSTIVDRYTVIEGSDGVGLEYPVGITVYSDGEDDSLLVVDSAKNEIVHVQKANSANKSVSILARNGTDGISLNSPTYLFLDIDHQKDLYVADAMNSRVLLLPSMQLIAPPPENVAGTFGAGGTASNLLSGPNGIAVDNDKNIFVVDTYNYRIMLWGPNATTGSPVVGTGDPGSGSKQLQSPAGLFLTKYNSLLYVADTGNHRVQVFNLTDTPLYSGTTVAGGNGPGSGSNQLNQPSDVWVSTRTGAVYVVDTGNHRVQRWDPGATMGVTVVGDTNGSPGADSTKLSSPSGLSITGNEMHLYVTDSGNQRIQRFDLK